MSLSDLEVLEYDQLKERLAEYAVSAPGKERAAALSPSYSGLQSLREEHRTVSEAVRLQASDAPIPLQGLLDVRQPVRLLKTSALNAEEFIALGGHLRVARRVSNYFEKQREEESGETRGEEPELLIRRMERLVPLPELLAEIEHIFTDEGEMADDASPQLRTIRRRLRRARERIQTRLDSALQNPAYQEALQDRLITIRNGRYVIPVKQNFRGVVKGASQGQSASGATVYIEPLSVMEANNELDRLLGEEAREIQRILTELSASARERLEQLRGNVEALAELDFVRAKADFALDYGCSEPVMMEEPVLDLKNARHPLLIWHFRQEKRRNPKQPLRKAVPLSIRLDEETRAVVVTGPNTGGKTIALKTAGLLALMAQSGMPIPADPGSQLGVFDAVCADIGDEQSIEQNLSTFSSHMTRVIRILGQATPRTLAVLDEVAAGTDPSEGAALGAAILDELLRKGAKILVTTHHGALKLYAHERKHAANAAMTFNENDLTPTYQLRMGVPGSSRALQIARGLGMPVSVLEAAERQAGAGAVEMESMLQEVDRLQRKMESESAELEKRLRAAEARELEYKNRIDALRSQREELRRQAEGEAQAIVRGARATVERTVAEIRTTQASKESIESARAQIHEKELALERAKQEQRRKAAEERRNLPEGSVVYIPAMQAKGVIVDPPNESGTTRARVGQMTVTVSAAEIETREEDQAAVQELPKRFRRLAAEKRADISIEIDLRGMRALEAVEEADKYLDDASLAGLDQVSIIHGKGSGALRQALHDSLRNHPTARKYRLGTLDEGGAGVTIVTVS